MSEPKSGWYPDPTGRHQRRAWDGSKWLDHVADGGVVSSDPIVNPRHPVDEPRRPPSSRTVSPVQAGGHTPAASAVTPDNGSMGTAAASTIPPTRPQAQSPSHVTGGGTGAAHRPWKGVTIRENDDVIGDALYPVPGSQANTVALAASDGSAPTVVTAEGIELERYDERGGRWEGEASISDVKIGVYVTDCRVAFVCSRYDKGGGWVGGVGAMVVLNAASMVRAAVRSRGTTLVGHVRYPWLSNIGAAPKAGWGGSEQIAFTCQDAATGSILRLVLMFPKQVAALDLANQIASRCARYRLSTEPGVTPEIRATLERALAAPVLHVPEKGKLATYSFKPASKVEAATAYGPVV